MAPFYTDPERVVFHLKSLIMTNVAEALFYQEDGTGLFVRAQGHITAAVSTDLRELVLERLARPPVPALLAVDLSACDYMDSTFMGLLVGFHKKYKQLTGRALTVLRPSPECLKLLTGLGILALMTVVSGADPQTPDAWKTIEPRKGPAAEILLKAHQDLSDLSADNDRQFSALRAVLEQQVEKPEDR
jgi:anti-anti-sigma factor